MLNDVPGGSAAALGVHGYGEGHPGSGTFLRFYEAVVGFLEQHGIGPTYVAAEGESYSGKFVRFGERAHERLLRTRMAHVNVLSVAANSPDSEEPSYDSFASVSLSYIPASGESVLCSVINEGLVGLFSNAYYELLTAVVGLCDWDFGYGFASPVAKHPELHILGLDDGQLSPEEQASLSAWYAATRQMRLNHLRDVYPYTIVRGKFLDSRLRDGSVLRNLMEREPGTSLTQLTDNGLYLWKVPEVALVRLRRELRVRGALIPLDQP
ncbi:MAG: hypothetical protein ABI584_02665 [Acidobacteriota bacterium]